MAAPKAIFLLCVHTLCTSLAQEQNYFIVSPSSKTAGLNLAAIFICRFDGDVVTGIVNGFTVEDRDDVAVISDEYDFPSLPIGTYDLAMMVNASEANNNSEIWCQGRGPDVNSSHAQLMVQGTLAAPSNLSSEAINDTAISLKWSPPFTLDITDVDPDISNYTVHIANTATGLNETRTGIVDTSLIFSGLLGEDPTPCHDYSFTVIANNVVGEGEESEEVLQHFEGECPGKFTPPGENVSWWIWMIVVITVAALLFLALCVIIYCYRKSKRVVHGGERPNQISLDLGNSNPSSGAGNGDLDRDSVAKGSDDANHDVSGPSGAGRDAEADVVASSSNEEIGAPSRIQKDGDKAEGPTLGGPMPPPQMQQKGVSGQGLRRRRPDYQHSEPELADFKELVVSELVATKSEKWRELGQELELSPTSLDKIANQAASLEQRFIAVFEDRLRKKSVTWKGIIQALESPRVGESTLAGSLKDKLTYY